MPYSCKCDIWSLGCVIYELAALKPPFLGKNMNELYTKVTKGTFAPIPKHFSENLARMISLCLNTDPKLRPTAKDLAVELGIMPKQEKTHRRSSSTQD